MVLAAGSHNTWLPPSACWRGRGPRPIQNLRTVAARQRWGTAACWLLALVGATCMVIDIVRPYRTREDQWMRQVIRDVGRQCKPNDQVVVLNKAAETDVVFQWELETPERPRRRHSLGRNAGRGSLANRCRQAVRAGHQRSGQRDGRRPQRPGLDFGRPRALFLSAVQERRARSALRCLSVGSRSA